jgi:small subunit ribosomal protein S6
MLVLNPALSQEENASARERVNDLLTREGGEIVSEDDWGTRRLAYPIKRAGQNYLEGSYYLIKFNQEGSFIRELEAQLRLTEPVLRSMVVRATPIVESRPRPMPPDARPAPATAPVGAPVAAEAAVAAPAEAQVDAPAAADVAEPTAEAEPAQAEAPASIEAQVDAPAAADVEEPAAGEDLQSEAGDAEEQRS